MGELSPCRLMPFAAGHSEGDLLTTCDLKATPVLPESQALLSNAGAHGSLSLGDKIPL